MQHLAGSRRIKQNTTNQTDDWNVNMRVETWANEHGEDLSPHGISVGVFLPWLFTSCIRV